MCDLRRNKRCRGARFYMTRCGILRMIMCPEAWAYRRRRAALLTLAREEEARRALGAECQVGR
jgi:hypothetical protein